MDVFALQDYDGKRCFKNVLCLRQSIFLNKILKHICTFHVEMHALVSRDGHRNAIGLASAHALMQEHARQNRFADAF